MHRSQSAQGLSPEVIIVAGARPNFMKVAPVLAAHSRRAPAFGLQLVHTGQHYDEQMSDVFFRELGIRPPDVSLEVGPGTQGAQTGRILERFERYLLEREAPPVAVMVVGDVNSTAACGLAAVKLQIPVVHLEAGLRSFDRSMPEEINRLVTDTISDLLLVSDPAGEENLRNEGVAAERVVFVGNVMIDTLLRELSGARALNQPAQLGLRENGYAVVTLHRPANVDDPQKLGALIEFLLDLSARLPVAFPVHPRTRGRMEESGWIKRLAGVQTFRLLPPLSYRENLSLLAGARMVLTDSGGIQEETSVLGVPCLTLRPNTERPVTLSEGTNTLVGSDFGLAGRLVDEILAGRYRKGSQIRGWDGQASDRVLDALARYIPR